MQISKSPARVIHFKTYAFRVQWKFIVLTAVFFSLFVALGFWQLQRAHEKRQLEAAFATRLQAAPLSLAQIVAQPSQFVYSPIKIQGYFDNAHTILLDNKFYQHQLGYDVLTPFIIPGQAQQILINRGWIPAGLRRQSLPAIPRINGMQTLIGRVYVPEKAFILGATFEQTSQWPKRAQGIRLVDFSQILQVPLYPFLILLDTPASLGFVRDWHPVTMPAYKHVGYAVQWFCFAAILLIIFLVKHLRKSE